MKKTFIVLMLALYGLVNLVWANHTRMGILMAGDYIDDIVNIDLYPNQIVVYENTLYGDITTGTEDYGIILSPYHKYGAFACWQNAQPTQEFNIGYAIKLLKFDIGVSGSPVKDHLRFGFGIGRTYFSRRIDLSFHVADEIDEESYILNLRLTGRKGDFVIVPKYSLKIMKEPYDYNKHRIGIMLKRLILNEGFVFFVGEYEFQRGDIENDRTNIYAGLDLPLNKKFALLLGVREQFTDGFETPVWQIEPGISVRIREFVFDFHLNQERLFDKDLTFFNSFGLDLHFGRF